LVHIQHDRDRREIFIIHQCIYFWGASTAQAADERPGNLQFTNADDVSAQAKQGHLNNIRISNGNVSQVPAKASGVLGVEYLTNNGGPVKPPADVFNFTVSVEIPNDTSGVYSKDPYGGIRSLIKRASGHGPNVTVSKGPTSNLVVIPNEGENTVNLYFT